MNKLSLFLDSIYPFYKWVWFKFIMSLFFKYLNENLNINAIVFSHFRIKWFRKIKRDLLSGWTTRLWFIFKLIRVLQAYRRTVNGATDHFNFTYGNLRNKHSTFLDPCWSIAENKLELNLEKQAAWKYCMNISIFIGSSVALFGIFGIAVFWYKIMMEYNERRGMFFCRFWFGFTCDANTVKI